MAIPPVITLAAGPGPGVGAPRGWPVLRLGFRPFYLGAAAFGLLAIPWWVAWLTGRAQPPMALPPLLWHAHEMLFGFAVAVIIGFLLTAGQNWTGLATARGGALAGLVLLWLAARVAGALGPGALYAGLDLLVLPAFAFYFVGLLWRAGHRRSLPIGLILLLLALANTVFHLAVLGWVDLPPVRAVHAGLALVVLIECVIGGRVIPAFTRSALVGATREVPRALEIAAMGSVTAALAGWIGWPHSPLTGAALALAAALQLARWWHWTPWRSRSRPILWILHAAYAWLPVGLALLALAARGLASASAGIHALAVGATGGLIIGMMTRTARGHTGRPLHASRAEVAAYLLMLAAAVLRVVAPLLAPQATVAWWIAAAAAWSGAMALYLVVFAPWLLSTRLDGRDG